MSIAYIEITKTAGMLAYSNIKIPKYTNISEYIIGNVECVAVDTFKIAPAYT